MTNVAIFFKTKSSVKNNNYQTGGLGCNALHTVASLKRLGVKAEAYAVKDFVDLATIFAINNAMTPITHAIIEAVWVTAKELKALSEDFPNAKFVVRAHSKIGFLASEPEAIPVVRDIIGLNNKNTVFASNNEEFAKSLSDVYGHTLYLPNLYDISTSPQHVPNIDNTLRIASFGASRLLKMHPNGALAALQIAKKLNRKLKFYINVDSTPGGFSVVKTIRNLFANVPNVELIEVGWQPPEEFRKTVANLDLFISLSSTESFGMAVADAVASGVPVVVGPAIEWMALEYCAFIDDTTNAAHLGIDFLNRPGYVADDQKRMLMNFLVKAEKDWLKFLGIKAPKPWYQRLFK